MPTTTSIQNRATFGNVSQYGESPDTGLREEQVEELLLQALETEMGGIEVYETALRCAQDDELREEWGEYLGQTREHERILRDVLEAFGIDADRQTPGRRVVRLLGHSLVDAMEQALDAGEREAAQLVAAECVVLAETKDHLNWELLGEVVKELDGERRTALKQAHDAVEEQEDEHLYHTQGWTRELWLQALGLPAVIPPPEERKDVRSAIGAARAKKARGRVLGGKRGGRKQGTKRAAAKARGGSRAGTAGRGTGAGRSRQASGGRKRGASRSGGNRAGNRGGTGGSRGSGGSGGSGRVDQRGNQTGNQRRAAVAMR